MQDIEAIIFDLDGTLLDTIADLTDAMNAALAKWNYPLLSVDECKHLVGDGIEVFARGALPPHARDAQTVYEVVSVSTKQYAQNWTRKTKPYEGIVDMLTFLNRHRVPLAVLSNKEDRFVKQCVAHFLPTEYFAEIRGAQSSMPLKPDPTPALDVAEKLGAAPSRTLFVGDTKTDMQTAVAAGMLPMGVLWGFRSADELREHGAQAMAEVPDDITAFLGVTLART